MHYLIRLLTFTCITFLFLSKTKAQDVFVPKKDFIISSQGHLGYIMAHRNNMGGLIKGHVYGGEINYIFRTNGCKTWHQVYQYPELGFSFMHMYLSNPSQLGNLEALYPYTNIRLNKLTNKTAVILRLGSGLAYLTKAFDRLENHQNVAIGSHLNGFVNLRLSMSRMITPSWRMDAGIGLTHASNGAFASPNLGLNIAGITVGIGYVVGKKSCTYITNDTLEPFTKKWHPSVIGVLGIKELEDPDGNKYMAYSLQGNFMRDLNRKNSLGGGVEVFYNNATKQRWFADSVYTNKPLDIIQAGTKLCYAYNFHKLSFPVEFGVYFLKKQPVNGWFFHRIGFRYKITDHFIANVTLLTHFAKADYFEYGIGWEF